MTTTLFRGALACALLTSTALTAPAPAQEQQTAAIAPPAEKFAIAPGGVDMRSGRYVYEQTDLAIGGEGGGLTLARTLTQPVAGHNSPFANFSHNWEILLAEKRVNIQQNLFQHTIGQPDYQIEVVGGGLTQTFRAAGPNGGFEQVSRSGYARLTWTGDRNGTGAVYTYSSGDGAVALFRPIGSGDCSSSLRCAYVSELIQADGTRLVFDYDNPGSNATRLRSVTSSRGYALLLEYAGGAVSKACVLNLALAPKPANNLCPAGAQTATYAYTSVPGGGPALASATDPAGAAWGFTYGAATMGFIRPGDAAAWLTNTIWRRGNDDGLIEEIITDQQFADGSSYAYGWESAPEVPGRVAQIAGGAFEDNLGNVTTLRYDFPTLPFDPSQGHGNVPGDDTPGPRIQQMTPGPVEVTDPLGRFTTTDYCDPNAMLNLPQNWMARCLVSPAAVSTTDPEGIRTVLTWDFATRNLLGIRQVAKPGSLQPNGQPWPDITRSATYNCTPATLRYCTKPVTLTDARGAVTEFAYSADHGGLLSETGPAPGAGAPRPQTRHEYAQRHAWVSNGAGGYVQAATPVWVRTATSACRTSAATGNPAAPCATADDELRTTYDYGPDAGPNNLLLRGTLVTGAGAGARTCYGYDTQGRRISETGPGAGLASCP
jgi:YD repeat-containing protein